MMRFALNQICLMSLLFYAQGAFAGWVSSGGEISNYAYNPWFINNVESVSFCIKHSEEFGTSRRQAVASFRSALEYWRNEFDSDNHLGLAQQRFVEESCQPNTMLKIQFGTLDEQQKEFLREPERLVAVAVRTDYLTGIGRGFIYVSPEHGPLAMLHQNLVAEPWSVGNGRLLDLVLTHELGHVFGLRHEGKSHEMMAATFPETVVDAKSYWRYLTPTMRPDYLNYREGPWWLGWDSEAGCKFRNSGRIATYLGISPTLKCLDFRVVDLRGLVPRLDIYVHESPEDQPQLLTSVRLLDRETDRQSVLSFRSPHDLDVAYWGDIAKREITLFGFFEPNSGIKRSMMVKIGPNRLTIVMELNKRFKTLIDLKP